MNKQGFTLMEIMVVVAIIALISSIISVNLVGMFNSAQVDATKTQIETMISSMQLYRLHCNSYPTTEQGLTALINKPTVGRDCPRYQPGGYFGSGKNEIPLDPWGGVYIFESNGNTFSICSRGPNGINALDTEFICETR